MQLPEEEFNIELLSSLFAHPVVVWVPGVLNPNRKPFCINERCTCTPRVNGYLSRVVEDVYHKTTLLYVKYECSGAFGTSFSTVHPDYMRRFTRVQLQFPYVLTKKSGVSLALLDQVHDAMLSGGGMLGLMASLNRRRHNRYYHLLSIFGALARERADSGRVVLPPSPRSVEDYMTEHAPPSRETLTDLWMERTSMVPAFAEALRRQLQIKHLLRMDHTAKFPRRLFDWKGQGIRENLKDIQLLLLVLNEIGQVVGHAFTKSENNEETEAELRKILSTCSIHPINTSSEDDRGSIYVVSDNVNAVRGMLTRFGDSPVDFVVKQDPFHVVQRFTSKVRGGASKGLPKELKEAIYTHDGELHEPSKMKTLLASVVGRVAPKSISCSTAEWAGTVRNNLQQIERGDLYVPHNRFSEGGGRVKVVSTSQVEGLNSALKHLNRSVSVPVGARILDLHFFQHNISVGAQFLRSPSLGGADVSMICRSAIVCDNVVRTSPQQEFCLNLIPPAPSTATRHNPTIHHFNFGT